MSHLPKIELVRASFFSEKLVATASSSVVTADNRKHLFGRELIDFRYYTIRVLLDMF